MAQSRYTVKTYALFVAAETRSKGQGEAIGHVVTVDNPGLMFDLTATEKPAGEYCFACCRFFWLAISCFWLSNILAYRQHPYQLTVNDGQAQRDQRTMAAGNEEKDVGADNHVVAISSRLLPNLNHNLKNLYLILALIPVLEGLRHNIRSTSQDQRTGRFGKIRHIRNAIS